MKFESDQKENSGIPVAFLDGEGNLWFRSTNEPDVMDNKVFVIIAGENTAVEHYVMDVFVACLKNDDQRPKYNYAVKKFYEGDTIITTF